MTITINKAIALMPEWSGKKVSIEPLSGGITNRNFKIKVNGLPFFVSLPGDNTQLLGVDWHNKFYNSKICGEAGLSPKVVQHFPLQQLLVLEFLPFTHCSVASLQRLEEQHRLVRTLQQLHRGSCFWQEFDMFRLIAFYLTMIKERKLHSLIGYAKYAARIENIGTMLTPYRKNLAPCHNDLVPENIMVDEKRIFLLDFDYSGNNDPCFDLGSISIEAGYDDAQIRQLANAYYGQVSEQIMARIHLHIIMGDVGWSLWSLIQAQISSIEFDFNAYGLSRWQRACQKMESSECNLWLRTLRTHN